VKHKVQEGELVFLPLALLQNFSGCHYAQDGVMAPPDRKIDLKTNYFEEEGKRRKITQYFRFGVSVEKNLAKSWLWFSRLSIMERLESFFQAFFSG